MHSGPELIATYQHSRKSEDGYSKTKVEPTVTCRCHAYCIQKETVENWNRRCQKVCLSSVSSLYLSDTPNTAER